MKAVVIDGSPRAASTSRALADRLCDLLQSRGHDQVEIQRISLRGLQFRGCAGCRACKGAAERCVMNDGLSPVLASLAAADAVVLGAGVFMADLPAGLKALIDRCYSFYLPEFWQKTWKSRFAAPKKLGFILAQGEAPAEKHDDVLPRYARALGDVGFHCPPEARVRGLGLDSPEAAAAAPGLEPGLRRLADFLLA